MFYGITHIERIGMAHMMTSNGHYRCCFTAPHAGRAQHPHPGGISPVSQILMQRLCSGQLTRKRITYTQGYCRWWRLFVVNNIEMGVEGGRFINSRHGQIHERGQGPEPGHGEVTVGVLHCMQVFNQTIPAAQ